MFGQLVADIDRTAVGMVDAQPPAVQVHLAADRAGQERALAAIFAVADDRVADLRHMDAQLVGAPGQRLPFDTRRAVSRPFDDAVARLRCEAAVLDLPLLATRSRLLGERQVDLALLYTEHPAQHPP